MAYAISKRIFWPVLSLFIRRIDGLENLSDKPFIIAANHASYMDGILLLFLVARYKNKKLCTFATNTGFTGLFWSILLRHYGAIRIGRSLEKGLKALKQGKDLAIFPEGGRSYDGKMRKITHTGLGVLALLSKAPVIPVGMNTYTFWNRHNLLPTFRKTIEIRIGKPESFKGKLTRKQAKKITLQTMKEVKRLAGISDNKTA